MPGFFDDENGGLITHWKTIAGITALVGADTAARIYPEAAPSGVNVPYILFTRITGEPVIYLGGPTGARRTVLQVWCFGATPAAADALSELVKQNTQNMRGTYTGVVVNRVQVFSITSGFNYRQGSNDLKDFWVMMTIHFVHGES